MWSISRFSKDPHATHGPLLSIHSRRRSETHFRWYSFCAFAVGIGMSFAPKSFQLRLVSFTQMQHVAAHLTPTLESIHRQLVYSLSHIYEGVHLRNETGWRCAIGVDIQRAFTLTVLEPEFHVRTRPGLFTRISYAHGKQRH
jgi:hypothetical protein